MQVESLRMPRNLVLLRGRDMGYSQSSGLIYIPEEEVMKYPTSGWVINLGSRCEEGLERGDYVFWADKGMEELPTYYDVFHLVLSTEDGKTHNILAAMEDEPRIREAAERYRRRKEDQVIRIRDVKEGEQIAFLASNVRSLQRAELANPHYRLEYVEASRLVIWDEEEGKFIIYLIMPETEILGKWDDGY